MEGSARSVISATCPLRRSLPPWSSAGTHALSGRFEDRGPDCRGQVVAEGEPQVRLVAVLGGPLRRASRTGSDQDLQGHDPLGRDLVDRQSITVA